MRPVAYFNIIGIIACLLLTLTASAQTDESSALTLKQAVELTIKNNPELQQATERVNSAQAAVSGEVGDFLPELTFSASGYRQCDRAGNLQGEDTEQRRFNGLDATASAKVPVFHGMENIASMKRSSLERDAEIDYRTWERETLALETASRFLQVVKDQELVRVQEKNLEENQQQFHRIEDFYRAGKRPVTDLYQQKAETSQAKKLLLDARHDLEVNRLLLIQTMGLPDPVSFLVVPPPLPSEAVDPDRLDRERTVEQAMTGRADVRSQQLGVEAVSNKVREAKSGYWPQLDLFGNMRSGYSTWDDETSFEDQFFEDQVVGSFGLSVSIPLFDRLRTRTSVHQARAESRITQLELAKLRQEVAVEVGRAIEDYRTALQQVSVAQDQLEAARLALSATQERYAVGASTLLELTAARNTMLQANTDWVNARYDLVEKRLTLAHIEGSLMEVLPTFYSVEEIQ